MSRTIALVKNMQEIIDRGPIVAWNFRNTLTPFAGKFAVRFTLIFSNGETSDRQVGGYETQREAQAAKNAIIEQLIKREYVANRIMACDFYDYWLNEYMVKVRKIAYNTFMTYRNIIQNYLMPVIKKKKLDEVTQKDILTALNSMTPGLLSPAYAVFGSSFKYAKKYSLISKNIATRAISLKRKQETKKKANVRAKVAINAASQNVVQPKKKREYALTADQIGQMLIIAKNKYPNLYLPLLIACTTGCRISELIALRYRDVDYSKKVLYIRGQSGRPVDASFIEKGSKTKQRLNTKSKNGIRELPVPDFVLDEIVVSRKNWEMSVESKGKNTEDIAIWHRSDGTSYNRQSYKKDFVSLKEVYGLPDDFHWHDLRHAYATLMVHYQVNIKELAVVLGHASGTFTMKHYVVPFQKVCESIPEFEEVFLNAMPIKIENEEIVLKETLIFEVPGFNKYSNNLIKSSTNKAEYLGLGKDWLAETHEIPYNSAV